MTLREIFSAALGFADANAVGIFWLSLAIPIIGIALARVGRGGRSEEDGKLFANVFVFIAVVQFVVAMIVGYAGVAFLERSLLDTSVPLLVAPWIWLGLSIAGLRLVFPLSELTSWRSVLDLGGFVVACAALVWFLSMFRGWGILFVGGLVQLALLFVLAAFLLRVLYVRAFRRDVV